MQSLHSILIVERPGLLKLRKKVGGSFDRTRDKLREETYKSEKLNYVLRRFHFPTKNINTVTECLEGIKTDSDRKNNPQKQSVRSPSEKQFGKRGGEEVIILEDTKNKQIDDDVFDTDCLCPFRRAAELFEKEAGKIATKRSECDQE